jgi:hypothetical protein
VNFIQAVPKFEPGERLTAADGLECDGSLAQLLYELCHEMIFISGSVSLIIGSILTIRPLKSPSRICIVPVRGCPGFPVQSFEL